jgi:hypothetical protein
VTRDYLAPVHTPRPRPRPRLTLAQLVGTTVLAVAAALVGWAIGWQVAEWALGAR